MVAYSIDFQQIIYKKSTLKSIRVPFFKDYVLIICRSWLRIRAWALLHKPGADDR